jgi:DNA-binding transcriptional regulator YhcF (GntR family)
LDRYLAQGYIPVTFTMQNKSIDHGSRTPKYQQIVDAILTGISSNQWNHGDQIPSVNETSEQYGIARMTVVKAYDELRRRGIIEAHQGKGYYIAATDVKTGYNILLLFDELSSYKEIMYNGFKETLPPNARVSIFFHHYDRNTFDNLLAANLGRFTHYVVVAHVSTDISASLEKIPPHQLTLLDKDVPTLKYPVACVHQDFENDIQEGLRQGLDLLKKYRRLNMLCPQAPLTYMPDGRNNGFIRFCENHKMPYRILTGFDSAVVFRDEAYILFDERELVKFIKYCREKDWQLGKDIGLVSYDDTPYKEIIDKGITVISTDFRQMGITGARMLLDKVVDKIHNPCQLIIRGSL